MITSLAVAVREAGKEIKRNMDFAVVGMSGGVDSTVVACLCKLALGKENVEGVHMPYSKLDKDTFNSDSIKIANKLNINSRRVPITKITDAITWTMVNEADLFMSKLNGGNARSRARMCTLYAIAGALNSKFKERVRVVGTGNLSEDFIGYDTKGGDSLGDIFPIGDLYKSEVYQLADYFVQTGLLDESMIDHKPSAGLWEGQTDEDELGYSYNEMERSIRKVRFKVPYNGAIVNDRYVPEINECDKFVLKRHFTNKHKHEAPPVIPLRKYCD